MNGDKKSIDEIIKFLKEEPLDPAAGETVHRRMFKLFCL